MTTIQISKHELYELIKEAIREELSEIILSLFEEETVSEKEEKRIKKILEENKKVGYIKAEEFLSKLKRFNLNPL